MNPFICPHSERTAADEDGYEICVKCGAVYLVHLTKERLAECFKYGLRR